MAQNTFGNTSKLVQVTALLLSGNKSLPDPMLTHIYVSIWCLNATTGLIV